MNVTISSIRMSPFSREPVHRAHMQTAASYLIPSPPAYLIDVFSDFSFEVVSQDSIDKITGTVRERVDQLSDAGGKIFGIIQLLQDAQAMASISAQASEVTEEFQQGLAGQLSIILKGVSAAHAAKVDKNGMISGGRRKAHLPGTRPAKYTARQL
jgi:hypothetical protein